MDIDFQKLNKDNSALLANFTCLEDSEHLKKLGFNKSDRKKVKKHSEGIDSFLKKEALLEQGKNLNATHLLIDKDNNELIGFVSICNDSIPLEVDEKNGYGFSYKTIPALKIARLAINNKYQRNHYSILLFNYVIYLAVKIRELTGFAFITLDCYKHRLDYYTNKFGFVKNQIQNESKADDPPISMRLLIDDYLDKLAN